MITLALAAAADGKYPLLCHFKGNAESRTND